MKLCVFGVYKMLQNPISDISMQFDVKIQSEIYTAIV